VRRTLSLAALAALGAILVLVVRAPSPPEPAALVRGHRVFRVVPGAVRALEVSLDGRRFAARRSPEGWEIDGRRATVRSAEALSDLVDLLGALRAVDVFRPRDGASYGLDHPRGTITVVTARRTRRVVLGDSNAVASALYARRQGDPRVLQVGTLLLSAIERVLYHRDAGGRGTPAS
jgi:hypothetical protein